MSRARSVRFSRRWTGEWRLLGSALVSLAFAACSVHKPVSTARVQRGPAFSHKPKKLISLPVTCSAINTVEKFLGMEIVEERATERFCTDGNRQAMTIRTRMGFEFAGYHVYDSELVNVHLRERIEYLRESGGQEWQGVKKIGGKGWEEATPKEQWELMEAMGVDSLLETHVAISEALNFDRDRRVEIHVTVRSAKDRSVVWRSRCAAQTGKHYTYGQALDRVASCALGALSVVEGR